MDNQPENGWLMLKKKTLSAIIKKYGEEKHSKLIARGIKNYQLENEIKSLKTDINYIKHVAKHEHDMAEEDELIFKDKSGSKRKTP